MSAALWLLAGLALGSTGVWWLQRAELERWRRDAKEAQDRLFYAWRDEKVVPAPRTTEPAKVEALPAALREYVDQWEDPEVRLEQETRVRSLYFDRGMGEAAVLKELEAPKY